MGNGKGRGRTESSPFLPGFRVLRLQRSFRLFRPVLRIFVLFLYKLVCYLLLFQLFLRSPKRTRRHFVAFNERPMCAVVHDILNILANTQHGGP
jgi:hypothetical protein